MVENPGMTQGGTGDLVRQLRMLADLHAAGALDGDEFALAKQRLLSGGGAVGRVPDTTMTSADGPQVPAVPAAAPAAPRAAHPFDPDAPSTPSERSAGVFAEAAVQQRGRIAAGVAGGGGLLTLLAFLAMPIATVPFLGSITGAGLAGYSSELGSLGMLWLIPLAAAVVALVAGWQLFGSGPGPRRVASVASTLLAVLACVVYLVGLVQFGEAISDSGGSGFGIDASDVIGSGFWIGLLGSVVAVVASVAAIPASEPAGGR
ncbi:SHOCT domain-containing protein [Pseudonocardia saturnea]